MIHNVVLCNMQHLLAINTVRLNVPNVQFHSQFSTSTKPGDSISRF